MVSTSSGRSAEQDFRDIEQSPYGKPGSQIDTTTPVTGTLTVEEDTMLPSGEHEMTLNMGPQHPSTHGVLRLVLELDGEIVNGAKVTIGYLHTGIEKTAEQKKWQQVIPLVERMDYLDAQANSLAYALSVERLLGLPADRAKVVDGAIEVGSGATVDVGLVPRPGRYRLRCTHTFHTALGMRGWILVR